MGQTDTGRPLKIGLHMPEVERLVRWRETAELCRLAEHVGFDSIWMPDHLLYRYPDKEPDGPWECWSFLSAIAALTSRVEIGPLVLCTNFRNPGLIAKMAATVDEISGGRLILGLGAGWNHVEYDAFGFPYDHRFGRFKEAFTIIRTLLAEGAIDFEGDYYTLRDCELRPRGPRPEGPPLMIGSRGSRMLHETLPYVQSWNAWAAWFGNRPEGFEELVAQVRRACEDVGRDLETLDLTTAVFVQVEGGDDPDDPRGPYLRGTDDEIAEGLRAFAAAGASHLQIVLDPMTITGIERFARVLEKLRG